MQPTREQERKLRELQMRYRQLTPEQIALLRGSNAEVSQELMRLQRLAFRRTIDQTKASAMSKTVQT